MATQRKNVNTPRVTRMNPAFPQAVMAGGFIFLSGTPGLDPATGKIVSEDFEAQARQCFVNIGMILEDAGSSLAQVVKTTVFMVHGHDFAALNNVYAEVFGEQAPARSTPQVMPFPAGMLISVECIATV